MEGRTMSMMLNPKKGGAQKDKNKGKTDPKSDVKNDVKNDRGRSLADDNAPRSNDGAMMNKTQVTHKGRQS